MNHKTIKGIIFKTHNSGLSDKIVNLILENGERKSFLAKSSRKATSKKLSSLEIGNLVKIKFIEGYNIGIISDVKIENEFVNWKKDYKAMIYLQFICEIIDKFVHENIEEYELYNLLIKILSSKNEKIDYDFIAAIFLLKVMDISGHIGDLSDCLVTNEPLQPNSIYKTDLEFGIGYVNDEAVDTPKEKIDDRIFKTQNFILKTNDINSALKINLTPEEKRKMLKLHLEWAENILDREIKSKKILFNV